MFLRGEDNLRQKKPKTKKYIMGMDSYTKYLAGVTKIQKKYFKEREIKTGTSVRPTERIRWVWISPRLTKGILMIKIRPKSN